MEMTSAPPAILLLHPLLNRISPRLKTIAEICSLEDLNRTPSVAHRVRVIASIGTIPFNAAVLDQLPALGAIVCMSAGYDAIDTGLLTQRGILLANAPGAGTDDVAELSLALALASLRRIQGGDALVRGGGWTAANRGERRRSLFRSNVGIVGLGSIGQRAARLFRAIGAEVAWWGPREKPKASYPRATTLRALAEQSDVLVLTLPLSEETRGLVDRTVIDALGPDGLLINVARGPIVDEDALCNALVEGRLGAAALDVFVEEPTPASRWANVPNVLLSPHAGAYTFDAAERLNDLVVANIARFLTDGTLLTPVRA
ncbi:NAD(P)-dependent oxidoreductase [Sphingomonas immobilis]|uniref:NAD(P)-dependent oxidoreductase n=1 Tax=Sphingomonas immobilis TaxID=3063997 RepID=A0ABT9A1B4_9SPHN|nr:NAD(P)-dependent oxidoreductase [Sphingomonas sp. CA1-15]MDO7843627.1 NAD(P)-dependent oxidoreductase [Sphingomonas sp. CA1-15]